MFTLHKELRLSEEHLNIWNKSFFWDRTQILKGPKSQNLGNLGKLQISRRKLNYIKALFTVDLWEDVKIFQVVIYSVNLCAHGTKIKTHLCSLQTGPSALLCCCCWSSRVTLEVPWTVLWTEPGGFTVLPAMLPPAVATKCESPPSSPECLPSSTGSTPWASFAFAIKSKWYIFTFF